LRAKGALLRSGVVFERGDRHRDGAHSDGVELYFVHRFDDLMTVLGVRLPFARQAEDVSVNLADVRDDDDERGDDGGKGITARSPLARVLHINRALVLDVVVEAFYGAQQPVTIGCTLRVQTP
jgi:hypothetical protein